jgi:Mn2+/Fe2+ NRAMP family transporter
MQNTAAVDSAGGASRLGELIKSFGPGIMMATAAVGGSHLVASTKAGAIYGWQLAVVLLLVNLFK